VVRGVSIIEPLAYSSRVLIKYQAGPLEEETKTAFVREVERIGRDQIYWVRKEASFALGALAKIVPEEVVVCSLVYTYSLGFPSAALSDDFFPFICSCQFLTLCARIQCGMCAILRYSPFPPFFHGSHQGNAAYSQSTP